MKVWIDMANSPHPLIFAPICNRLEAVGADVAVTVRDHAQTLELSRERWPTAPVIGGGSPAGRLSKAGAIGSRLRDLISWARDERPDVALSYNSYAQILAARALGIPAVTGMDYEHQPANHVAFRAAGTILLPDAVPVRAVRRQGASPAKVIRHFGLKEELYLGDSVSDPGVLARIGISRRPSRLVVARTAAAGAAYHRGENPLFEQTLRMLASQPDLTTIVLPRLDQQRAAIRAMDLGNVVMPEAVVSTRSLLGLADLFIGAGGTMTREAALLGVPTLTMFAGRAPAVDRHLEAEGKLARLVSVDQVATVDAAPPGRSSLERIRVNGRRIEQAFLAATLDAFRSS